MEDPPAGNTRHPDHGNFISSRPCANQIPRTVTGLYWDKEASLYGAWHAQFQTGVLNAVGQAYCTVSVVEPVTLFEFAPMTVVPTPLVVATPAMLGAFAIVATLAMDELKCVVSVMSWVVPSLNDPVAVNC